MRDLEEAGRSAPGRPNTRSPRRTGSLKGFPEFTVIREPLSLAEYHGVLRKVVAWWEWLKREECQLRTPCDCGEPDETGYCQIIKRSYRTDGGRLRLDTDLETMRDCKRHREQMAEMKAFAKRLGLRPAVAGD